MLTGMLRSGDDRIWIEVDFQKDCLSLQRVPEEGDLDLQPPQLELTSLGLALVSRSQGDLQKIYFLGGSQIADRKYALPLLAFLELWKELDGFRKQ